MVSMQTAEGSEYGRATDDRRRRATYRGVAVTVKHYEQASITLSRTDLLELNTVRGGEEGEGIRWRGGVGRGGEREARQRAIYRGVAVTVIVIML